MLTLSRKVTYNSKSRYKINIEINNTSSKWISSLLLNTLCVNEHIYVEEGEQAISCAFRNLGSGETLPPPAEDDTRTRAHLVLRRTRHLEGHFLRLWKLREGFWEARLEDEQNGGRQEAMLKQGMVREMEEI